MSSSSSTSSFKTPQCMECHQKSSSILCCGKKLCTGCFYFSEHVRHTALHHESKHAVVTAPKACRFEILSLVKPTFDQVWNELANDISKEMQKESAKRSEDPLSSLFDNEAIASSASIRGGEKNRNKRKMVHPTTTTTSSKQQLVVAPSENHVQQTTNTTRTDIGSIGSKQQITTSTQDFTKRTLTRPHDMWNHTGKLTITSTTHTENSFHNKGPKCPICEETDTSKMDDFDRGRKSEIWGSNTDTFTVNCNKCGHRWSVED